MNSWMQTSTIVFSMLLCNVVAAAGCYAFPADIESLRQDSTITELLQDHKIAAVRDAIAQ